MKSLAQRVLIEKLIPSVSYVKTLDQCETMEDIQRLYDETSRVRKMYFNDWNKYGYRFDKKEELHVCIELCNKLFKIIQEGKFSPIEETENKQLDLFDMIGEPIKEGTNIYIEDHKYEVNKISREAAKPFILEMHYAKRMAPISFFYGLFKDNKLVGVCTVGKPGSKSLCEGLLGVENKECVYELNRLITIEGLGKNSLSYFVGQVLKDLKKLNLVIVSYADTGAGHCGYIYQATNWVYTGTTRKNSKDYYVPNGGHSRSYTPELREKFKDLRIIRSVKHRYIYFACDKTHKKKYKKLLKYEIIKEYPKEENTNYILGERVKRKIINIKTGEIYYE